MQTDTIWFQAVNSLAGVYPILDVVGIFFAKYLIYLMGAGALIFCWQTHRRVGWLRGLETTIKIFSSAIVAYLINVVIGALFFRPRPFVVLDGVQKLIEKSELEKSFPSGHATVAFALAAALYFINPKWGKIFFALAALVSIGRIFVGVHYPLDVLGGLTVGLISAFMVTMVYPNSHRKIG